MPATRCSTQTLLPTPLQFRGQAEAVGSVTLVAARAPSALLVSVVDRNGPHGRFEDVGGTEAVFRATLDDNGPVEGEIDFGGGTTLRLRAAERHASGASPGRTCDTGRRCSRW